MIPPESVFVHHDAEGKADDQVSEHDGQTVGERKPEGFPGNFPRRVFTYVLLIIIHEWAFPLFRQESIIEMKLKKSYEFLKKTVSVFQNVLYS